MNGTETMAGSPTSPAPIWWKNTPKSPTAITTRRSDSLGMGKLESEMEPATDRHLTDWPRLRDEKKLEEIFDRQEFVQYWTNIFNQMYENTGPNTWDYQWFYTGFKNNLITVVPSVNLVSNIGFGPGATHTPIADRRFMVPAGSIEFPLRHPSSFVPLRSLDRHLFQKMLPPSIPRRVADKIYRIRRSFSSSDL